MLTKINDLNKYPVYGEILSCLSERKRTAVPGANRYEKLFLAGSMPQFVLYVSSDYVAAQEALRYFNELSGGGFVFLPYAEDTLIYRQNVGKVFSERNAALNAILSGARGVVVCADALAAKYPMKKDFVAARTTIAAGDVVELSKLAALLTACGYKRVDKTESAGQFSIRGDIADIFTPNSDAPTRLDFFDDVVESIKKVDVETFRSSESVEEISIFPISAVLRQEGQAKAALALRKSAERQKLSPDARVRLDVVVNECINALENGTADNVWLSPFLESSTLAEWLPENTIVVWDEPKLINDRVTRVFDEHYMRVANLLAAGEILPEHAGQLVERDKLFTAFDGAGQLALMGLPSTGTFFRSDAVVALKSTPLFNYKFNIRQLADDIVRWQVNGYSTAVFCDGDRAKGIASALDEMGCGISVLDSEPNELKGSAVISTRLPRGFVSHSNKLVLVGCDDLLVQSAERKTKKLSQQREKVFLALEKGDYAVHEVHGIGLCDGVHTLSGSFGTKDFIKIIYRDNEAVYVPVENTDMLSKYGGAETAPRLSKLGGAEFEKVKAKVKNSLKEMAIDLLKLYAARRNARGFSYVSDTYLEEEFAAAFPFVETEDQLKCIKEIDTDLKSDRIMDRLLVGDVGFGKTEVAMRAAFKVVSNGCQAAVLVPTTILAEQHFNTFKERFERFDVKVACLNRFRSAAEQKKIISQLASGDVDVVVGTHRLLSKDIKFKNLGLLVLDEEQRFGVEDKEKIKVLKTGVDVLTMSATPIPRTLHMALTGMRDISTITTPPGERMAVESYVTNESDALIRDVILREYNRGGQVFFVYNRVETIEYFAERVRRLVPEVKIVVAHGQMPEEVLENSIYNFGKGMFDVLICSTIIENGIDIPNANTMIIFDADKLGLSQLYQLRGRVGRGNRLAFAYFLYRDGKILGETAYKRLCSIAEYSELGSGFKIAMKDLEIRGAGNVLGREQHGHMQKVGYDMYVKLLNEAVSEIEGKPIAVMPNTVVEADVDAFVPEDYIDRDNRMTLYRRLAALSGADEGDKLREELREIYGEIPQETDNLINVALLKRLASDAGFEKVHVGKTFAQLDLADKKYLNNEKLFAEIDHRKDYCRLDVSKKLSVNFNFANGNAADNVRQLEKFLSALG